MFVASANIVGSITVTNPGLCMSQPMVYIINTPPSVGVGASATALLKGALIMTGKSMTEGFDPDYGRMDIRLGSAPNPLTPNVGNGLVVGVARYIDPPTELLVNGQTILWRLTHLGVDSHAMHFHLFDLQVINRADWTNVLKPPYFDEIGWRETIRTNPMEDIFLAIKPQAMVLPFPLPQSNRLLDVTTPLNSTTNFLAVAPPAGIAAVPQVTNVMTNFGFEYVYHCHLLGHEENDMMRPMVFSYATVASASAPGVAYNPVLGKYSIVVRNANNTISLGTANVDGIVNADFNPLPSGTTTTLPKIVWDPLHQKLIVAAQSGTSLMVANMNADGSGFSGLTLIATGAATTASPAIAWNSTTGKLQYAIWATTNNIWLGQMNYNGTGATQTLLAGTVADSAPAIAIDSTGKVYLAIKNATNNVLVGTANPNGSGFSGWITATGTNSTTNAAIGIAWNQATSLLDVVIKGAANSNVYKSSWNGGGTFATNFTQVGVTGVVVATTVPAAGIIPGFSALLTNLNIFSLNAGNIAGYTTPAL